MNHVTICRAKCLAIVTLNVLPTSCSCYDSEEKSQKFPISKLKINRINASSLTRCLEDFRKMTGFSKVYTFISILHEHFRSCYCLMVW